jgi:hypothetical protein
MEQLQVIKQVKYKTIIIMVMGKSRKYLEDPKVFTFIMILIAIITQVRS